MADGLLSLNWNNHGATFCHTLASLRGKEKYTDVTVSCGGRFYQVHKLVLSTCSEYFEKIFDNTPCKHPVIVLRDVQCEELEPLLNYMYKGVVSVAQSELSRLIKVAELLQIKGLAVPDEPPPPSKQSPNKRTSDDRLEHRSSTDGNGSPYPKRRRRRESDSYQASTSKAPSSSPSRQKKEDPLAIPWRDDQSSRRIDDRTKDSSQDHVRSPIQVNINETLIKEEIVDDDPEESVLSEGDFIGLGNAPSDGSQDPGGLLIPKFDDAADAADGSIAEPDVEPLAGPSGLQGWADGGDMTRIAASLGEGFVGTESQDMSSSVSLPSQPSGQASRQMIMEFISTIRGKRKLLVDGYAYIVDRRKDTTTYWRCDRKRSCTGRLRTQNDVIQGEASFHTHPPDAERNLTLKTVQKIKDTAKQSKEGALDMIHSCTSEYPLDDISALRKKENLVRIVNRQRVNMQ